MIAFLDGLPCPVDDDIVSSSSFYILYSEYDFFKLYLLSSDVQYVMIKAKNNCSKDAT